MDEEVERLKKKIAEAKDRITRSEVVKMFIN